MSSDSDIVIVDDSDERLESRSSHSSSYCSSSSSSNELQNRNLQKGDAFSPTISSLPPPPSIHPSSSVGTMTDDIPLPKALQDRLEFELVLMQSAVSSCINKPLAVAPKESILEKRRSSLAEEQQRMGNVLKRLREVSESCKAGVNGEDTSESQPKRWRSEKPENALLEKPSWYDALQSLCSELTLMDKVGHVTDSVSHSKSSSTTVQYLLQPPPVIELRSCDNNLLNSKGLPLSNSGSLLSSSGNMKGENPPEASEESNQRCPRCAEVEVVLQKEKASSILPIYSELWRLRKERRSYTQSSMNEKLEQLSWQEHLFDRVKAQIEKELNFYHHQLLFLSTSFPEGHALNYSRGLGNANSSLETLQKDLQQLKEIRQELASLHRSMPLTSEGIAPINPQVRKGGHEEHTSHSFSQPDPLINSSFPSLLPNANMQCDVLKEETNQLRKQLAEEVQKSMQWEKLYQSACAALNNSLEDRGYIRLELAQAHSKAQKKKWADVVQVLGWEVENLTQESVTLVHPGVQGSQYRKEVTLHSSMVDGVRVPDTAQYLARCIVNETKTISLNHATSPKAAHFTQSSLSSAFTSPSPFPVPLSTHALVATTEAQGGSCSAVPPSEESPEKLDNSLSSNLTSDPPPHPVAAVLEAHSEDSVRGSEEVVAPACVPSMPISLPDGAESPPRSEENTILEARSTEPEPLNCATAVLTENCEAVGESVVSSDAKEMENPNEEPKLSPFLDTNSPSPDFSVSEPQNEMVHTKANESETESAVNADSTAVEEQPHPVFPDEEQGVDGVSAEEHEQEEINSCASRESEQVVKEGSSFFDNGF